ncbi:tetratricopeptide repeat protein [Acrocarpospora sp. B8E8]|uniref:tetratricopeptide repeat protein n=1 Tax=Acrocarpospora sp. B8E8 TaxID=3153572 RepID=UPI00325F4F99
MRFFRAALDGEGEQAHIDQIVGLCNGLPLALTIMAARSQVSPIEELASSARNTRNRLAEIADGERSIRSAFEISYLALPEHLRRILGMLGLHPGGDWTAHHVAALADLDLATARRYLERLVNARLIERNSSQRFEIHDLIGDFARLKADSDLSAAARDAARSRLIAWSLDMVARADEAITPGRYRPPIEPTGHSVPFTDEASASAWLAAEQKNLVAACQLAFDTGADSACWRLAAMLRGHFFLTKQWDDWLATHTWALAAAERARDRDGEAMTRNNLGLALMEIGRLDEADEHFLIVLNRLADAGDGFARANALANHAAIAYCRGEYERSLRLNQEALTLYVERRHARNQAITLRSIGLVELELGRHEQAVTHLTMALQMFSVPHRPISLDGAMAVNCLGEAWLRAGTWRRPSPGSHAGSRTAATAAAATRRRGRYVDSARWRSPRADQRTRESAGVPRSAISADSAPPRPRRSPA